MDHHSVKIKRVVIEGPNLANGKFWSGERHYIACEECGLVADSISPCGPCYATRNRW